MEDSNKKKLFFHHAFKLCIFILKVGVTISCHQALAKSQTVILSGYSLSKDEDKAFYGAASEVVRTSLKRKRDVIVAANTGDWNFNRYGLKINPLTSVEDLRSAIRSAASNVKENEDDTLTVVLIGHGAAPKEYDDPGSASFYLGSTWLSFLINGAPSISYTELEEILRREVPAKVPIKIINSICFSGGVHQISLHLENVCSIASTDFTSVTQVTGNMLGQTEMYHISVWNNLIVYPTNGLMPAHFSALFVDSVQEVRGNTSSQDYIDRVLKMGAYDNSLRGDLGQKDPRSVVPRLIDVRDWNALSDEEFQKRFQEIGKMVLEIESGLQYQDILFTTAFRNTFNKVKKQFEEDQKIVLENVRGYRSTQNLLNHYQSQTSMEHFNRIFDKFRRAVYFSQVATPEQKRVFSRLLHCETEAL